MKSNHCEHVRVDVSGAVATVVFDRPPNNHVSVELLRSLGDALEEADRNPLVRVSVLMSEGRHFCAGADFTTPGDTGEDPEADVNLVYAQAHRLFCLDKPVVAAVQGAAIGAGLGLALAADFRVATVESRFAANFVRLGFHPGFGLSLTLPRLIGQQRAQLMLLTGRRIDGLTAESWGLVDLLAPSSDLGPAARSLAEEIATAGPLGVLATRRTLRLGLSEAVRKQMEIEDREQRPLRQTQDFAEGVKATAERRTAHFVGE